MEPTPMPPQTPTTPETPQTAQTTPTVSQNDPGHGMAIASIVTGLLGMGLVGLILGIIANKKSKAVNIKNNLAVIGIVISAISMLIATIFIVVAIILAIAVTPVIKKCQELGPGTHHEGGTTYTCS